MIIQIYDYLHKHEVLRWSILAVCLIMVLLLASRLSYKEDISDFLPLGTSDRDNLAIYQDIAGASQVVAVFDNAGDEEQTTQAIERFCDVLTVCDTLKMVSKIVSKFDLAKYSEISEFAYANIPYFLSDRDYILIDSLLTSPEYVSKQIKADKEMLLFPSGGLLTDNIARDPLNLFTPIISKLGKSQEYSHFESYDGFIFTPDMKQAIVLIQSPFGNSETKNNAQLISILDAAADQTKRDFPEVKIHLTGGPQIAVDNANQIKKDSVLALTIAIVFITLILAYSFRSFRNILLIVVSILWGWLFALASLSFVHSDISIIVIGISSVIVGIAVNYPLHMIDHVNHEQDIRRSLRDIVTPLLIGNITTIGAFLTLIPLKSVALRELGLFASLLLLGTISFVLLFLPHMIRVRSDHQHKPFFSALVNAKIETKPRLLYFMIAITAVLAIFSLNTEFDANMANINYMSDEQKEYMASFQSMLDGNKSDSTEVLYIVSSANDMDKALAESMSKRKDLEALAHSGIITNIKSALPFLSDKKEQQRRLDLWKEMVGKHRKIFNEELMRCAQANGFSPEAFDEFHNILSATYTPHEFEDFSPLTKSVFIGNFSIDQAQVRYSVVDKVTVKNEYLNQIRAQFKDSFSVESMNCSIANSLSNDFNYIGFACSLIVFVFLWLSFGRIELAIISFLPMLISWIWILGLMSIFGMKFNIVNIILATFIFGQGDDYTIFITEGCQYEYAYRKSMPASYKNSIVLSAMIMFVGIGALIVAQHPALHSLAELTIIGMFSVVLMAYIIPPLLFKWMTKSHGRYRKRPLTLGALLRTWGCGAWWLGQLTLGYIGGFLMFTVFGRRPATRRFFHKFVTHAHRVDLKFLPGVKNKIHNPNGEDFSKPCVIVCNHQSLLDPMYLMALSPKIIIVANQRSSLNPVVRLMFKWLDFYTIRENTFENDIPKFKNFIEEGYSVAVYAEGERNPDSSILRFHKGAFLLAQRLNIDILPIYLHGVNNIMPIRSFAANPGTINLLIGKRITKASPLWGEDYSETTRRVHQHFVNHYEKFRSKYETAVYFEKFVKERYIYKGLNIYSKAKKSLSKTNLQWVDSIPLDRDIVIIKNCGNGALALLTALVHKKKKVYALEDGEDERLIASASAYGLARNFKVVTSEEEITEMLEENKIMRYPISSVELVCV